MGYFSTQKLLDTEFFKTAEVEATEASERLAYLDGILEKYFSGWEVLSEEIEALEVG